MLLNFFCLLCFISSFHAKITLNQNKYSGLTIHIRSDIPESEANDVIQKLKHLFTKGSEALFHATNRRGYIGNVDIITPTNWTTIAAKELDVKLPIEKVIVTEKANAQYGNNPYVLNLEECGEPGEYIHFTRQFLVGDQSSFGEPRAFMLHLFGHLFYGLRDEFGNAFDQSETYYVNNKRVVEPIRCSKSITVQALDDKGNECKVTENCLKVPKNCNLKIKADGSASAMYYPYGGALKFCDDGDNVAENEKHNPDAPTPQNYFCDGKSAWTIMRESDDFKNGNNPPISENTKPDLTPQFNIYRENSDVLNIVIVIDVSGSMDDPPPGSSFRLRQIVHSACNEYINDYVAVDDRIAIVQFNQYYKILHQLTTVTEVNKASIKQSIPNYATGGTSIKSGVSGGVEALGNAARGGIMILMTDGQSSQDDLVSAKNIAYNSGITVYSIMLTDDATSYLKDIADATGGQTFFTTGQTISNNQQTVSEVLRSIGNIQDGIRTRKSLKGSRDIATQVSKQFVHILPNQKSTKTIVIDEFSVSFSMIISTNINPNNIIVELFSPNGVKIDIDKIKIIDINSGSLKITVPAAGGEWKYLVSVASGSSKTEITVDIISYTSDHASQISFTGKYKSTYLDLNINPKPVKIESKLLFGDYAIIDAQITAFVFYNDSLIEEVSLNDQGVGADVFLNDGIYTGFFSNISGNGRYTLRLTASNPKSKASYSTVAKSDGLTDKSNGCSGTGSSRTFLKPFERTTVGNFLTVVGYTYSSDFYAPSKVKDLKFIGPNWDKNVLIFEWTAVGDDLNFGIASKYDFRRSSSSNSLRKSFNSSTKVEEIANLSPKISGEKEKFEMKMVDDCKDNFYVGLKVIDDVGQSSKLSNVVAVSYEKSKCSSSSFGNRNKLEIFSLFLAFMSFFFL